MKNETLLILVIVIMLGVVCISGCTSEPGKVGIGIDSGGNPVLKTNNSTNLILPVLIIENGHTSTSNTIHEALSNN